MVRHPRDDAEEDWSAERFSSVLAPFFETYSQLVFDHRSRLADKTTITPSGQNRWKAVQVLCDSEGEDLWFIEATVDLNDVETLEGPIIAVERIGS